ncbi:hypothetical protein D3C76_1630200 [compost metagenome]
MIIFTVEAITGYETNHIIYVGNDRDIAFDIGKIVDIQKKENEPLIDNVNDAYCFDVKEWENGRIVKQHMINAE